MYIEPNTTIKLYHNVPLDNTYNHTIWFDTITNQSNYFHGNSSILKYTLAKQTYQRVEKGVMRVELLADNIYDCNYMAFQNTNYGNKWFYAFVTGVEYVNNATSQITFELDVMQTYLFDVTLKNCFVEREHSITDVAGDNIVDEGIPVGEYYNSAMIKTGLFDEYCMALCSPYKFLTGGQLTAFHGGEMVTGNPSCLKSYYMRGETTEETLSYLTAVLAYFASASHDDEILCIYQIPASFVDTTGTDVYKDLPTDSNSVSQSYTYATKPTTLGTYEPRNKKLLTYPFNKFTITTFNGEVHDYAYEYFDSNDISFDFYPNLTPNVGVRAVPLHYKGELHNYYESSVMSDIPLIAYYTEAYRQWFSQNKTRLALQGVQGMLGGQRGIGEIVRGQNMKTPVTNVVSSRGAKHIGKGVTQMVKGYGAIADMISQCISARALGNIPVGSNEGSLEIANGVKDFVYCQNYVNPMLAPIIDDYFDMFGYATNRIKQPNRSSRPAWNYVKTRSCIVIGNAPADYVNEICSIYDSGITFWKDATKVGDYTQDNTPTS